MGYLNDLLSRNPLVIDGDKIRPHHKYTDDLYTGGKITMTNYDRIKLMSVDEMADKIYLSKCNCCKLLDEANVPHPWHCTTSCRKYIKQWLLQEVSDNDR